jgi:hypothetical protein
MILRCLAQVLRFRPGVANKPGRDMMEWGGRYAIRPTEIFVPFLVHRLSIRCVGR